jgi:DNA-binding MarR family transcriptional regulator
METTTTVRGVRPPRAARSPRLDLVELWALGQSVDRLVQDELRRHGASGSLLAVLAAVARGASTTSDVAAVLGQAFMTTSDQLDRLEAAGEIRRIPNPHDARSKLIRLSARGDRRLRRTGPRIRAIERAIAEQLETDVPHIASALADLRRAIDLAAAELEMGT